MSAILEDRENLPRGGNLTLRTSRCLGVGNLTLASMKMSNSPGSAPPPPPWGLTLIGALHTRTRMIIGDICIQTVSENVIKSLLCCTYKETLAKPSFLKEKAVFIRFMHLETWFNDFCHFVRENFSGGGGGRLGSRVSLSHFFSPFKLGTHYRTSRRNLSLRVYILEN